MCPEITLRKYRPGDVEAMIRLDEICFADAFRFDRESMRSFAEARNAVSLVGENGNGEIAGFVILHVERRAAGVCGYVVTLDVAPDHRREGLASRLMQEAERRAVEAGARWMELHVFTGNEGAIRFYERMGYVRIGVRRRFYWQAGLDGYVYRKDLANL